MTLAYLRPASLPEAVEALSQYGYDAKVIAGGTAVVLMLQQKLIAPQVLVSLVRIPFLDRIGVDGQALHLGPMLSMDAVTRSPLIQERLPALAQACAVVGNVRIRNQATLGGNLGHADYASDPPAVLLALDASVLVYGPPGKRTIPLADFLLGFYTTALSAEEVIADIVIPSLPLDTQMVYLKYRTRSSEDRPCVGVAAVATMDGKICRDLRLAVGAATEVPQRLARIEALAQNQVLSDELIDEIAGQYAAGLDPLDDLRGSAWYRRQLIRVQVKRALKAVSGGPG
ncbi:MAG: xanthine dehydrogenase family protein subunit M [Chloroflexi bacterium]|nr:xanthine dehydrogenase family protein subunit M [Chloroflexota bacterium]